MNRTQMSSIFQSLQVCFLEFWFDVISRAFVDVPKCHYTLDQYLAHVVVFFAENNFRTVPVSFVVGFLYVNEIRHIPSIDARVVKTRDSHAGHVSSRPTRCVFFLLWRYNFESEYIVISHNMFAFFQYILSETSNEMVQVKSLKKYSIISFYFNVIITENFVNIL